MLAKEVDYVSFLLRLWQSDEDGHLVWRASLESAQTGEKRHFSSVSVLVDYMGREFGGRERANEEAGPCKEWDRPFPKPNRAWEEDKNHLSGGTR
jgi:hypothetical protein